MLSPFYIYQLFDGIIEVYLGFFDVKEWTKTNKFSMGIFNL